MRQSNLAYQIPNNQRHWWGAPEEITVPEWVEKNVRLPRFTSAEPGPLRISRTPYTRGPLLALGSPFIEHIVLVWGRQLGKSQGVQYPFLCYAIVQDPGPAICLLPTIDKSKYTSKKRLQPMFNACEAVRDEKTDNPDDFSILEMQFKRMILSMAWGGSGMQLTTRPARYLLRDEVDELKKTVGQNAVDPMEAIEQTTSNFPNRKIVDTGTPTTGQGNIWKELKTCQYVFELWVKCPHCHVPQILYWENVRFGEDHDPIVVEENAYYECEACHQIISNLDKLRILGNDWRARTTPDPCDQIIKNIRARFEETISLDEILDDPKYRRIKKIGFHLPKWYSPFSGGTFGIIAKEFLEANKALQEGDDFAPMRNWRIYNAARPWEEIAISETEIELMANKIDLPPFVCPQGTIALTTGIDPGQGGFWFAVIAWRRDYGAHLVQYGWLAGDYDTSGIDAILKEWTFVVDQEERRLHIWRIGIDTGGGQYSAADTTMTEAAYTWIRRMRSTRLFGTKGLSVERIRRIKESRIDKMPGDKGAIIPGGLILIEINSDAMKDVMWFHLHVEEEKAGRFTFNNGTETDYVKHLLAEEKRLQKDGTWEWIRIRKDNHLLDCTVIAFAMADSEFRGGIRVIRPSGKADPTDPNKLPPINPTTQRPRGTWVKGW